MTNSSFPTPLVSIDWLHQNLNNPELLILDTTLKKVGGVSPSDFVNQITGARFFDIKNTFSDPSSDLPNTLPQPEAFSKAARNLGINQHHKIVLYDAWGIYSAPRAWWMFKTMGHDEVSILNGGLPAWKATGGKTESKGTSHVISGNFQARFRPEKIKNIKEVIAAMNQNEKIILDARSRGRFNGTAAEPRAGLRGGHIPHSMSLPWNELVKEGKILPKAELKKIFEAMKIQQEEIICTCGSGVTASVIYLAAAILGYEDLSVYDGSWTEWGQRLDLPAIK